MIRYIAKTESELSTGGQLSWYVNCTYLIKQHPRGYLTIGSIVGTALSVNPSLVWRCKLILGILICHVAELTTLHRDIIRRGYPRILSLCAYALRLPETYVAVLSYSRTWQEESGGVPVTN